MTKVHRLYAQTNTVFTAPLYWVAILTILSSYAISITKFGDLKTCQNRSLSSVNDTHCPGSSDLPQVVLNAVHVAPFANVNKVEVPLFQFIFRQNFFGHDAVRAGRLPEHYHFITFNLCFHEFFGHDTYQSKLLLRRKTMCHYWAT